MCQQVVFQRNNYYITTLVLVSERKQSPIEVALLPDWSIFCEAGENIPFLRIYGETIMVRIMKTAMGFFGKLSKII